MKDQKKRKAAGKRALPARPSHYSARESKNLKAKGVKLPPTPAERFDLILDDLPARPVFVGLDLGAPPPHARHA